MPAKVADVSRQINEQVPSAGQTTWKHDGTSARAEGFTEKRIRSLEDLVEFFGIDLKAWKIRRWECSAYESHTRLRHYDGQVRIATGFARKDDEHKIVPLYRVWAQLEENRPLILLSDVKADILAEIKKHRPSYPKITHKKLPGSVALEINIFDLHFGKLVWDQEAGENFDIKIARDVFLRTIAQLIDYAKVFPIGQVIFPVGNDFFNVDSSDNTTTAGTKQDEDTRWKKTFKAGRELMVEGIDRLREIAPVYVPVIPGNHDAERAFYLGDSLECLYHAISGVTIDNGAKSRKYYRYGKNLIGYAHGKDEKPMDLPGLMAQEAPALWAETRFREFHVGDKHHKKEIHWKSTEEYKGVVVRYMPSLASTDVWHYQNGFIGNVRAGEAFIWHPEAGLICQLTAAL